MKAPKTVVKLSAGKKSAKVQMLVKSFRPRKFFWVPRNLLPNLTRLVARKV